MTQGGFLACFPAYALNPGTSDNPEQISRWAAQVITLEVKSRQLQGSIDRF